MFDPLGIFDKEFKKVHKDKDLTFRDIWKIYDEQFELIRQFILNLGDRFYVESFTGSTDKVITLKHAYTKNQVQVYINGIIQWKDEDYLESSHRTITLLGDRNEKDDVRVVILNSALSGKPIDVLNKFYYDRSEEELVVYNDPAYSVTGEELTLATLKQPVRSDNKESKSHDIESGQGD